MDIDDTALKDGAESKRQVAMNFGEAGFLKNAAELPPMKGVGETLGSRFVLEKCLGFGSTGTVYKAFDLRQLEKLASKPYVAVKIFNTSLNGDPDLRFALERTVQNLRALKHPNILAVEDMYLEGPLAYLTMEYVAGTSLSQMFNTPGFNGLPIQQALPIIGSVVKALTYAHGRATVHADLKPANVLFTAANRVKVMDFGLAHIFQQAKQRTELSVFDTSMLRGLTRAYVSADVLANATPDVADDMYSLACITYQLLTGRHPYDHMLATQAREMRLEAIRPKQLSAQQWHVLRNALSFESHAATPNLAQFFNALREAPRPRLHGKGAPALALAGVTAIAALIAVQHYQGADAVADAKAAIATIGVIDDRTTAAPPVLAGATSGGTSGTAGTAGTIDAGKGVTTDTAGAQQNATPAVAALASQTKNPVQPLSLAAVTPVLAAIPCSALAATVTDNTIDVQGFVSRTYGIAQLNATLAKIPGVENMKLDVKQIGEKDCAVMQVFAPYWLKSRNAGASLRTRSGDSRLTEGDALIVDLKTPNYGAWVHADYYSLDGGVIHLLPSLRAPDNQAPPSHAATVGSAGNWIVSAPFGNEMVVLLTTPAPLFNGLRPEKEATTDYLAAVATQLRRIESGNGAGRISVEFLQIQTQPRK